MSETIFHTDKMVLAYWAIRGLAQPIRLMLEYKGAAYEDKRFEQGPAPDFCKKCWTDVKDTILGDYPFPNLPYLIDGDLTLTQSNAILRHLGRKYELLGSSAVEAARVDLMLEEGMDFRNRTVGMAYGRAGNFEEVKADYAATLAKNCAKYSKYLGKNQYFGGGTTPTACDFVMYELLDQNSLMIPGCLDSFPTLQAFCKNFAALPKIAEYLASERNIIFPCNNQHSFTTQNKIC